MIRTLVATALTDPIASHGEGPVSLDDDGRAFAWLDMLVGDVLMTDVSTGSTERFELDADVVSMVRPIAGGGLVVTTENDVHVYPEGLRGESTLLARLPIPDGVRMNDGGCDALGRLWIGTMAYDVSPGAGELYVVDARGHHDVVVKDLTVSNGLSFSSDGTSAYFIDSTTYHVDRLTLDAVGTLTERRQWAATDEAWGLPDGLTVDADGGVWVAIFGGGRVVRFDPQGRLDTVVSLPVSQPTSCAFAGQTNRLLITTSRYGLNDDEQPAAGALFVADVPQCGAPTLPFVASIS